MCFVLVLDVEGVVKMERRWGWMGMGAEGGGGQWRGRGKGKRGEEGGRGEKGRILLQRSRTEAVEADVLAGVDDGEFAGEG